MLKRVKELVNFNLDIKVIKTLIDCPEIGFEICLIKHDVTSFSDLKFLVKSAKECPLSAANILKDGFIDALNKISLN